jgi:hypothetical protein
MSPRIALYGTVQECGVVSFKVSGLEFHADGVGFATELNLATTYDAKADKNECWMKDRKDIRSEHAQFSAHK